MQHYKTNWGFRTLKVSVCMLAVLGAACVQQPKRSSSYPVNMPASDSAQAGTAGGSGPSSSSASGVGKAAPRLREDAPLRYVVKKGDTLWGIANHFLRDAWQWPEIWYVNQQVKNPHLIYPGDVLSLIYVDGKPRIVSGDTEPSDGGVVRLSPRTREEGLDNAIPAIPIEAIRDFLTSSRIVTLDEMRKAPYIVAFVEPQIVAGAGAQAYVKDLKPGVASVYSVVRMGEAYRDPETKELLGYEAIPVGTAEVIEDTNKIATVRLIKSVREVRAGDRLLPLEKDTYEAFFYPKAPSRPVSGRILTVLDAATNITQYQVITINRGSDAGLEPGDVLTIMQSGRKARDPHSSADVSISLPDLEAGTCLVFKITPKISYALVTNSTRAIHRLDKVESPKSVP